MYKAKIEIEKGSTIKTELHNDSDNETNLQSEAPAYYGYLIDTIAGDGDPQDVIVFSNQELKQGEEVDVKIIACIEMTDNGEEDDKYIATTGKYVDFKRILEAKEYIESYKKEQGDNIEFGSIFYTSKI